MLFHVSTSRSSVLVGTFSVAVSMILTVERKEVPNKQPSNIMIPGYIDKYHQKGKKAKSISNSLREALPVIVKTKAKQAFKRTYFS